MKTSPAWNKVFVAAALVCGLAGPARAQGDLAPTGSPAPTMKTLEQIFNRTALTEPRTMCSAATTPGMSNYFFAVTNPGSYYLTDNLAAPKGGVLVLADDVTLDLCGFKLEGNPAQPYNGVSILDRSNVEVRNGTIVRFGQDGIGRDELGTSIGYGCRAIDVRVLRNIDDGISLGAGATIFRCTAVSNGENGIRSEKVSTVVDCISVSNTYDGIYCQAGSQIEGNVASGNGDIGILVNGYSRIEGNCARYNGSDGIHASDYGCRISGNVVAYNGAAGIWTSHGSEIRQNMVSYNNSLLYTNRGGIYVASGCYVVENNLYYNKVQAIYAHNEDSTIENNMVSGSPTGINFLVAGSLYLNNRFGGVATPVSGTATDGGGNISF